MGELLDYFKEKYTKKASVKVADALPRTEVKNTIIVLCGEKLKNVGDLFTFEVSQEDLAYAVTVIDEEPLCSTYNINQISKTLFEASLKEIDI